MEKVKRLDDKKDNAASRRHVEKAAIIRGAFKIRRLKRGAQSGYDLLSAPRFAC